MEGNPKCDERRLRRCYQCNRLEEELLAMVYGEVWPLIRKVPTVRQPPDNPNQRRSGFVSQQKIGA
jgi:hypothetical protein